MMETGLLFGIVLILLFKIYWAFKRPPNFPPGPKPLPIIGNALQMPQGHLFTVIEDLKKEYGPIIGFMAFGKPIVFLDGVDIIHAALRKEEFQSRPDLVVLKARTFDKNLGIFFSFGDQWMSSRKFTIKQLRAFGKYEKEILIIDEINQLMERIKDGEVVQADGLFGVAAVNVIWMLIANKRLDFKDAKAKEFLKNLSLMFRQGTPTGSLETFVPVLRSFSSTFKFAQQINHNIHEFIREAIREHREVLDPNNPLDLIDSYLVEIEQHKGNKASLFTEEDLISIGLDLFTAGAESTSNSIEFILLYMVLYPEVQAKMQEELDRVLGRARKPMLDDKTEMHYTMAVITEVERLNSIAPTNVIHYVTKDTTFNGFFFPKNTMINMNLRSLGNDPQYWKNPENFNPERYLDADGKFSKPSHLTTFGLGTRACVGEVFARNIIFIATTTFFEKFSISTPTGDPKPSTVPLTGFTTAPQPFRVNIKSRY